MRIEATGKTDVGHKRDHNEDAFLCAPTEGVFIVADGVGGAAAGEVASRLAVDETRRAFACSAAADLEARLRGALASAHEAIVARTERDPATRGMAATVVAVAPDVATGTMVVANLGDARCYRIRRGRAEQLSTDHTLVAQLLADGRIKPEDVASSPHRHVVTQALGAGEALSPSVLADAIEAGDVYLLCSDGIHDLVGAADLATTVAASLPDLDAACGRLVALALERGGHDNATVLLVGCGLAAADRKPPPGSPAPGPRRRRPERQRPRRPAAPEPPVGHGAASSWPRIAVGAALVGMALLGLVTLWPSADRDGRRGGDVATGRLAPPPSGSPAVPPPTAENPPPVAAPAALPTTVRWQSTTPAADVAVARPGGVLDFAASATSENGPTHVTYQWSVDGQPQGSGPQWTFAPPADGGARAWTVTVVASAGTARAERSWTVKAASRPAFAGFAPEGEVAQGLPGTPLRFTARATAPDGAVITYAWERNGARVEGHEGPMLVVDQPHDGDTVRVTAASDGGSVTRAWTVALRAPDEKHPPRVLAQIPPANDVVRVQEDATTEFRLRADDPDAGDELRYSWFLDGKPVGRSPTWRFTAPAASPESARRRIEVEVADRGGLVAPKVAWTVEVIPAPPALVRSAPSGEAVAVTATEPVEFSVAIARARDGISYEWSIDRGTAQRTTEGRFVLAPGTLQGSHSVEVVAVDATGARSVPRRWRVSVRPDEPAPAESTRVAARREEAPATAVTEAGAREWLQRYRAAMEQADVATLRRMGVVADGAQADRLAASLARLPLVAVHPESIAVAADGQHATVAFRRTHQDGKQTTDSPLITCQLVQGPGGLVVAGACSSSSR